jgi:prepilin-type N-terminal cleavage/methylation domain-containing protein
MVRGNIKAGSKRKIKSLHREDGFSLIELMLVVILIGVALGIIMINYGGSRRALALQSATTEVEALMKRSYNIALQEGVDVYLAFWDEAGAYPERCAIHRVYPDGTDEWTDNTPTEPAPPGVSSETTGDNQWFKLAGGAASVQSSVTLLFRREGSLVTVTSVTGGMSVTVDVGGQSSTVTINDRGEIIPSG